MEDALSSVFGGAATGVDVVVACATVVLAVTDVVENVEDMSACTPVDIGEAVDGLACLSDSIITDDKLTSSVAVSADDAADSVTVEMMVSIKVVPTAANEEDAGVVNDVNGAVDLEMTDCVVDVLFILCPMDASSPWSQSEEIKGGGEKGKYSHKSHTIIGLVYVERPSTRVNVETSMGNA